MGAVARSPRPFRARSSRVLLLALLAFACAARADADDEPRVREHVEIRLRTVKIRIVPSKKAAPGACSRLGVEDLDVSLHGRPVRDPSAIRLDREHRPTIHALVLDTSQSMGGRLEDMRSAGREYFASVLGEGDRALVVTFDDSVVLARAATGDGGAAGRGLENVRLGLQTEMLDALYETILELTTYRGRPVIVLVTDGIDTTSLHERDDVYRLAEARPDLTVFSISLGAPALSGVGPSGVLSSRGFLQRIAERTNGEFFSTLTTSDLSDIYRRIRDVLESEATLSVVDPDPETSRGGIQVRSRVAECDVKIAKDASRSGMSPSMAALEGPLPPLPYRLPLPPDPRLLAHAPEPEAAARACEPGSGLVIEPNRIRGCYLDLVMERGLLYEPLATERWDENTWLDLTGRTLDIPVPPPDDLPRGPEEVLDRLADQAILAEANPPASDPRKRPARRHAARYHAIPALSTGSSFFDLRLRLAHGLYLIPAYRAWADAAFAREAEMAGRRGAGPSEEDLARRLAAWLGDMPASELFARWEARSIERLLRSGPEATASDAFVERWRALRRVFFAPSYARVLTLLSPVRDLAADRIGYYRIVLPRPAWILPRLQNWKNRSDFTNLPMDLVPDLPFGYLVTRRLLEERPRLAEELAARGELAGSVDYELLGKPATRDPERAFARCRVLVKMDASAPEAGAAIRFLADMESARVVAFDPSGSGALEPLLREASTGLLETP